MQVIDEDTPQFSDRKWHVPDKGNKGDFAFLAVERAPLI
jgi:hypothetical protein